VWQRRRRSSSVPNLRLVFQDKRKKKKHPLQICQIESHHADSLYSVVSVLYAVFIMVMGATLPIAEIFVQNAGMRIGNFEGFYVYLFVVSIAFLIFVQLFVIRNQRNAVTTMLQRVVTKCRKEPTDIEQYGSSTNKSGCCLWTSAGEKRGTVENKAMSLNSHAHTGGFFLRLGAVGFGIGAMILEGLHFGEFLETDPYLECTQLTEVVRPLLQMIFILSQTYFIFRNSKMVIHKYRVVARFGKMHMVATNLCVWLRVIAIETMHELHHSTDDHHGDDNHHDDHHYDDALAADHGNASRHRRGYDSAVFMTNDSQIHAVDGHVDGCGHGQNQGMLSPAISKVRPYLFACTVEYSLITAGVMYLMWRNISPSPSSSSSTAASSHHGGHAITFSVPKDHHHSKPTQRIRVDWSGANRGLFLGILILTMTIISLVVFFNLSAGHHPERHDAAIILMLATELFIEAVSIIAVFGAAVKFRDLRFFADLENNLDQILLLLALVGVYLFNVMCSAAGAYRSSTPVGAVSLIASIVTLFQSTIQTLFILNGLRRSAVTKSHEVLKPGRQFVTFLIVSNTALWGINSFEILHAGSHPTAIDVFGFIPWSIITHVTVPLAIFYRYHSTVCLVDIWKDAYKTKGHNAHH